MSLEKVYLDALCDYLNEQLEDDPPLLGTIGLIQVGRFQDNWELSPAVVTLHINDPQDPGFVSARIDQQRSGANERSQLFGGYGEIGGGQSWKLRFSASVEYYFTRSGEEQVDATDKALDVLDWLEQKISQAQPWTLGIGQESRRTPELVVIVDRWSAEDGGPGSYIWHSRIRFEMLTHAELATF